MTKEVVVRIRAEDLSSQTFRRIATEATTMGTQVSTAATNADRSLDSMSQRGAKMGAALGTALGSTILLLGEFGRAAAEEEAVFARLEQAVVATGESYDKYLASIDQAIQRGKDLAFSDDQVADALGRMTTITGDAQAALDNLGLAMDLSRARGIDLSTASDLIGKAYTGNFQTLARFGILLDKNATSTEALAAIQAKTAGQAEAYGNTQAAAIDRWQNKLDDATESLGAHAGQITTVVALLPGLTAGWSIASGAVGGITGALTGGAGATGALVAFGSALASVAAVALVAAPAIAAIGYTAYTAKDHIEAVTTETEKLNQALAATGTTQDEYIRRIYGAFSQNLVSLEVNVGNTTQTLESSFDELMALEGEFATAFQESARQAAIDWNKPLDEQADKLAFLIDQVHYYYGLQLQLANSNVRLSPGTSGLERTGGRTYLEPPIPYYGDIATTGYTGPYQAPQTLPPRDTFSPGTSGLQGAVGMVQPWDQQAADLAAYRAELEATYGAYAGMVEGLNNANDAQEAFKATQDGLLESQQVYSQQISEYSGQVDALTAARDILQQRQAEGIALTADEQALLDKYPDLYARGTAGVEDATVAQGLLAAQYLENMEKGDEMNRALGESASATQDLVTVIENLILSMAGVPPEVKTEILLNRAEEAQASLNAVLSLINSIDGRTATFYINVAGTGVALGSPGGPSILPDLAMHGMTAYAHGGTVYDPLMPRFANGGTWAIVGERGPEAVYLSRGDQVINTEATRSRFGQRGTGGGIHLHGPVYIYPASGDVEREFTSALVGDWRST